MRLLVRAERLLRPLIQAYSRLRRGMTLGVRAVVLDAQGRVLLIEHTYVDGWHLPGGGVERGQTIEAALARELVEEAGVRVTGPVLLASVHDHGRVFRGDHVLVYRVDHWEPCLATSRGEIARIAWFAPDALPPETTEPTRARIAEVLERAPPAAHW